METQNGSWLKIKLVFIQFCFGFFKEKAIIEIQILQISFISSLKSQN